MTASGPILFLGLFFSGRLISAQNCEDKIECVRICAKELAEKFALELANDDVPLIMNISYSEKANFILERNARCPPEQTEFLLDPANNTKDVFKIHYNGSISYPNDDALAHYPAQTYCIVPQKDSQLRVIECGEEEAAEKCEEQNVFDEFKFSAYPWVFGTSAFFLAATVAVYLSECGKMTFQTTAITCHSFSMLVYFVGFNVAYTKTYYVQVWHCQALVFINYLSSMASFSWMTVICADIYAMFKKFYFRSQCQKMVILATFAWILPLLLTAILCVSYFYFQHEFREWKPVFAITKCWFETEESRLLFYTAPMAALLSLNLIMFGSSCVRLRRLQRQCDVRGAESRVFCGDVRRRSSRVLAFKLFVLMGVPWTFEVLSDLADFFAVDAFKAVFVVADLVNGLRGVLIFWVYVWSSTNGRAKLGRLLATLHKMTK
ncbi:probable G-protein coupled receptor Mth-like 11 [Neocloeon triangulifer]|uniref:probable G-protein coupled receptor Mth-like 11 n=1 Tax=Neocloeon triangulifer TaxID=2078957 RepID=UPI00286EFE5C|nr:probable G-protein coupled receptor Mth-like 11 [Neocloeon triangulifer]XP_059470926.1 probable G-protein coupled receptor Mth-like 11 [Neocloeon triangulifer]XP_059470927.1 probable G-protein coupled receptor Mth-like 11 [Neocloeon triangulifer]XP_059470928.1 probable G-protein coupled receptor Mth-like 11 [Neocloeon triangulifer]XP_059470929.1 probable G-protein coupled receptor Mth-like 11 [Neocloeon triangulifer]XP_059470930.1 probable G-protein coupled receptor Mth-like 11 [Neocloeon t